MAGQNVAVNIDASNILFAELGKQVGIEDLAFGEDNTCTLAFDDKLIFTFVRVGNDINLVSYLGQWDGSPEMARFMLESNFAWSKTAGATIAIEPDSERLVLCMKWNALDLQIGDFIAGLETLINVAEHFMKKIDDKDINSSTPSPSEPQTEAVEQESGPDFRQRV